MGGWGELYPIFLGMSGIFFNFARPLNECLNIKICKCLVSNQTNHPLEVVGRGSETQLQVGENLNYLI